ncbi:MAG: hypothetical protein RQM92_17720 [Candidatus Syntrophopropionicum ammoniitolerans]
MSSSGNRINILNAGYAKVGIGVVNGGPYGKMFVQLFIKPVSPIPDLPEEPVQPEDPAQTEEPGYPEEQPAQPEEPVQQENLYKLRKA